MFIATLTFRACQEFLSDWMKSLNSSKNQSSVLNKPFAISAKQFVSLGLTDCPDLSDAGH